MLHIFPSFSSPAWYSPSTTVSFPPSFPALFNRPGEAAHKPSWLKVEPNDKKNTMYQYIGKYCKRKDFRAA